MATIEGPMKKRRNFNHLFSVKKDRISSLPDPILVDIISLLSICDAINTSNLSRSWRYLWTQINAIHIIINSSKGPFKYWTSFHKKILPKLSSSLVRRFTLNIDYFPLGKHAVSQIDLWLRQVAVCLKIEEIKVSNNEGQICFPAIFEICSLIVLELIGDLASNVVPDMICLPNLKKLNIQIDFTHMKQFNFMKELFKSCPLLEDLSLDCGSLSLSPENISLSSHNLKRLSVWCVRCSGQYPLKYIEIDASNLEYLKLDFSNDGSMFRFLSIPSKLVEADINGSPSTSEGGLTSNIINAISNVRSLCIWRPLVGLRETMFVNLTRLICTIPCYKENELRALLRLLDRCPILEALTLNLTTTWNNSENILSSLWLLAYPLPTFVFTCLKRVEMNFMPCLLLNNEVVSLIKCLLTSARVLERLILKAIESIDDKISAEEECLEVEACKKVFEWARHSSSRLQVEFLGRYLRIIMSGEECKLFKGPKGYIICM